MSAKSTILADDGTVTIAENRRKRQRTAALQDLADGVARQPARQRPGVRLSSAALVSGAVTGRILVGQTNQICANSASLRLREYSPLFQSRTRNCSKAIRLPGMLLASTTLYTPFSSIVRSKIAWAIGLSDHSLAYSVTIQAPAQPGCASIQSQWC